MHVISLPGFDLLPRCCAPLWPQPALLFVANSAPDRCLGPSLNESSRTIIAYSSTSLRKTFSTTSARHTNDTINSLHTFSEEEVLLRESGKLLIGLPSHAANGYLVKRFAQDVVGPKVREMDENEMMDPSVIKGLFEQGVRNSLPPFPLYLAHVRCSSWASKQARIMAAQNPRSLQQ